MPKFTNEYWLVTVAPSMKLPTTERRRLYREAREILQAKKIEPIYRFPISQEKKAKNTQAKMEKALNGLVPVSCHKAFSLIL